MTARLRRWLEELSQTFWIIPIIMVSIGIVLAVCLVDLDRSGSIPRWMIQSSWLYNGGGTGARTLLGAVVSSTIGVAGTVFSITIAALSLAAGQMGPRLLRNFTRDRGNQVTLGAFLGTFSYALMVLRSVRTLSEGEFVPHLALSVAVILAFLCVATLVYFVGHMAGRINVDAVIDLVSEDVCSAIERLSVEAEPPAPPPDEFWSNAILVRETRRGYLQSLDQEELVKWATARDTAFRLLVRPGTYVFPGAPVALMSSPVEGAESAINESMALGPQRASSDDPEYAVRQLVEVAVRALSPGINDPHTAISVLDRLGAALCDVANTHLSSGVCLRDGKPRLVLPAIDYGGLADSMFHMIRQNARGSVSVLIRMLEVLAAVASCEEHPARKSVLKRHGDLVLNDAERSIANAQDLADLCQRHTNLGIALERGALALAINQKR